MSKKTKPIQPGEPLSIFFHPKDTPNGLVWHCGSIGTSPDMARGTVHISMGGATAEMTIEAARHFEEQLRCAINCVCEKKQP